MEKIITFNYLVVITISEQICVMTTRSRVSQGKNYEKLIFSKIIQANSRRDQKDKKLFYSQKKKPKLKLNKKPQPSNKKKIRKTLNHWKLSSNFCRKQ